MPMRHLESTLGSVRLIVERTDDLRRGVGSLPALFAAIRQTVSIGRRLIVLGKIGVCFKQESARQPPWQKSSGVHGSTLCPWRRSSNGSLESTEIMSYKCSIVHRDASSGASKSRIEFISPAPALRSLICRAAPTHKLIQTPCRHC